MRRAGWFMAAVFAIAGCDRGGGTPTAAPGYSQDVGAGPVEARLTLDRDSITTAERTALTIELSAPAGVGVLPPELPGEIGGFTVIEQQRSAPRLEGDAMTVRGVYTLEPFLDGAYTIPPITIPYTDRDGQSGRVITGPIAVTVRSVLPADQQAAAEIGPIRGITGPQDRRAPRSAVWAVGAGVLVLGAALAGWLILRRRARPAPSRCALAAERLRTMEGLPLRDGASVRAAVAEASSLLRVCLAATLDCSAEMRTTEELLSSATLTTTLAEPDMAWLRANLGTADAVKFAGVIIPDTQARDLIHGALDVIDRLAEIAARPSPAGGVNASKGMAA
jgi:hypothetical protein